MQKSRANIMNLERLRHQAKLMHQAQRCSATSKRTGKPLPGPVGTRTEGLPVSRSKGRRANGTSQRRLATRSAHSRKTSKNDAA